MRATLSLTRREFTAFFLSPIAYATLAVFLFVTGLLFYLTMSQLTETWGDGVEYPMQTFLGDSKFWLLFLFIAPLLTMRLLAEERGTGTLETLLTAPIRDWQVVFAKFAACFAFYLVLWIPTLVYLPILLDLHTTWHASFTPYSIALIAGIGLALLTLVLLILDANGGITFLLGSLAVLAIGGGGYLHYTQDAQQIIVFSAGIDPYPVLTSYLGVVLAGAMFLSIGLFVSSLVKSQLVAALIAMLISLPLVAAAFWRPDRDSGSFLYRLTKFISVPEHFREDFTRGLLDTRPLILYVSVTLFCLFLTVRSLEARRR